MRRFAALGRRAALHFVKLELPSRQRLGLRFLGSLLALRGQRSAELPSIPSTRRHGRTCLYCSLSGSSWMARAYASVASVKASQPMAAEPRRAQPLGQSGARAVVFNASRLAASHWHSAACAALRLEK